MIQIDIKKQLSHFQLDIKLEHHQGILGILGASGCGKSMSLKCIAGLQKPDSGSISLNERKLFNKSAKINLSPQKRKVGYLFQSYALFPNMTVEANIQMALKISNQSFKENFRKVDEFIDTLGIRPLMKAYPYQISGGQQQRVALVRALAASPEIILLDEPFAALDNQLKEVLRWEVKSLIQSQQMSGILVSHDRDDIYQICSHVAIMQEGKILEYGKTKDIFAKATFETSARLTGCKNILAAVKAGEHQVFIPSLNLYLNTEERVSEDVTSVGIRAHDWEIFLDQSKAHNVYEFKIDKMIELPFDWQMSSKEDVWWIINKESFSKECSTVSLYIPPQKILLLRK